MHQFQPPAESIVSAELTGAASILQPVVFKEGNEFCCLLGPDPQTGVMGCGETADVAVADWDARLKNHLATAGGSDVVVQYVQEFMGVKPAIAPDEQALLDKYGLRPVKR